MNVERRTLLTAWQGRSAKQVHYYMATQVFKKKIYEVKVETHFVLKPSNEIQNQIQVTYLN